MPVQLRFSDIDQLGHVNNNVVFSLYDMAKTEYFQSLFSKYVGDVVLVVASTSANFMHPVYYDNKLEIQTAVVRLGHKSITIAQRMVDSETGRVASTCRSVVVCFSKKQNCSVDIPYDARKVITDFEGSTQV